MQNTWLLSIISSLWKGTFQVKEKDSFLCIFYQWNIPMNVFRKWLLLNDWYSHEVFPHEKNISTQNLHNHKVSPIKTNKRWEKNTSKNLDFSFLHLIAWHYWCKNVNEYKQTVETGKRNIILSKKNLQCFQNDVSDENNLIGKIQMYAQG